MARPACVIGGQAARHVIPTTRLLNSAALLWRQAQHQQPPSNSSLLHPIPQGNLKAPSPRSYYLAFRLFSGLWVANGSFFGYIVNLLNFIIRNQGHIASHRIVSASLRLALQLPTPKQAHFHSFVPRTVSFCSLATNHVEIQPLNARTLFNLWNHGLK